MKQRFHLMRYIKMISSPKYGWCNFDLGVFHGTPS